ncbi:MAG: hypothetical protein HYU36_21280 [Planctomycetes bacterium]|nr:hypothetical protein [Planctomycetota bacterium]
MLRLDHIVKSEILWSPRALAAAGGSLTQVDGRTAARFESNTARKILLRCPRPDLREFDQFEVELWMPPGARGSLSLSIDLSSQTEGQARIDSGAGRACQRGGAGGAWGTSRRKISWSTASRTGGIRWGR